MDNNISCEIAKDLIPLYSEGLCSEESRLTVKKHLAECVSCRRLLETPVEQEQITEVPEEKNLFRKLNKTMKHRKVWIIILSIVLALIVGAVGFLTVGQIVRGEGMVSFETIAQSAEARKVVGYIVDKDFRSYVNSIYDNGLSQRTDSDIYEKILQKNADELSKAYEAAFGDAEVKAVNISSSYTVPSVPGSYVVWTKCSIEYQNGYLLELGLSKSYDNRFSAAAGPAIGKDKTTAETFCKCFNLINNMNGRNDMTTKSILERLYTRSEPIDSDQLQITADLISNRFAPAYSDEMKQSATEFFGKGYTTECVLGEDRYDEELNRYFDMYLTAEDGQGTALLTARIYRGYDGFIKPDSVSVYRNGCSEELARSLENFFG